MGYYMEMARGVIRDMPDSVWYLTPFWLILQIIALWQIFKKAGQPGWAALIPIYNLYLLFKIAWGKGWLVILTLVPIVNFVVYLILPFKVSRAFGKGFGFGLGLLFLPPIFYLILGFGASRYQGPNR